MMVIFMAVKVKILFTVICLLLTSPTRGQVGKALHWYNQGTDYLDSLQFHSAIRALLQAVDIQPDFVEAHNNLGLAYLRLKQYNNAIEHLKKSVGLQPNHSDALANLAMAYMKTKFYGEAILYYKKAIVYKQEFAIYNNLAYSYSKLKDYDNAIRYYLRCIQFKPDYPKAYYNLGVSYYQNRLVKESMKYFRKGCSLGHGKSCKYYDQLKKKKAGMPGNED